MTSPTRRPTRTPEWILAYVVVVGGILLVWNAAGGGLIEAWYAEYVGVDGRFAGSGAWRGEENASFQLFALLLGSWVYPLSIVAALSFAHRAWRSDDAGQRRRCIAAVVVALSVLGCFLQLGVLTAVVES